MSDDLKKLSPFYLTLFLLFISFGTYYPSLFAEVNTVDDLRMINNLLNTESYNLYQLFLPGTSGYYYRPLLMTTFLFDRFVWDLQTSFMHLGNVILHAFNGVLVFFTARKLADFASIDSTQLPVIASLLFILHPINTEPVNWISGRTDLLAGFFLFVALLIALHAIYRASTIMIAISAVCYFLATLSKENAVFFYPGMIFITYYCLNNSVQPVTSKHQSWSFYSIISLVPIGYFVIRHLAFNAHDSGIATAVKGISGQGHDLLNKVRIVFKTFGFYAKKLVAPLPLNFAIHEISGWYVIAGILATAVVIYFVCRRMIIGGLLFSAACLIVPALLVPLGRMAWTPLAERYLYIPSAFFSIAVVFGVWKILNKYSKFIPFTAVSTVTILFFSAYTVYSRNIVWQSNLTLFRDTVAKSPNFAPARNELGIALQQHGLFEEANKIFLNNESPQSDKYSKLTDMGKISVLLSQKDIDGALRIMNERPCDSSSPLFKECAEMQIRLNESAIIQKNITGNAAKKIRFENIDQVKKILAATGDPFQYYRIGKMYLTLKDEKKASEYFLLAADNAPAGSFYKESAHKMAVMFSKE